MTCSYVKGATVNVPASGAADETATAIIIEDSLTDDAKDKARMNKDADGRCSECQ